MENDEQDPHEMLREIDDPEQRARLAREFGLNGDPNNDYLVYGDGSGPQATLNRAIGAGELSEVSDDGGKRGLKKGMAKRSASSTSPALRLPLTRCPECGFELHA